MAKLDTVKDFVNYAIRQMDANDAYFGHGTTQSEEEAWWLILGFLKLPITEWEIYGDKKLNATEQKTLLNLIKRRAADKIPTAYLLNEAYLRGFKFYVNEHVLIPRSPIAELIEARFQPWLTHESKLNILDLCTGSGCLAILCAYYFPDAKVNASDISEAALTIAQKNITDYHLEERVQLIKSDIFKNIPLKKYDIIISNPPYVNARDIREMPKEYHHEPRLGLAAGEDGLDIVREILKEAKNYLTPHGLLIVEVGNSQAALEEAYPNLPLTWIAFNEGEDGVFLVFKEDL